MDGFIHKRRKREPKAKNGVVKLNSELFSGSISVIGRQRVMEDAVKVVHEFVSVAGNPYDFFGVYDGHGGAKVASACKERMHALLEKEVVVVEEEEGGGVVVEWEKVMRSCFWKMDEEVRTGGGGCGGGAKVEMVGSTAVVVVVGKEEVVVANCGDSRAVLCRGGVAVPLSRDHKVKWLLCVKCYRKQISYSFFSKFNQRGMAICWVCLDRRIERRVKKREVKLVNNKLIFNQFYLILLSTLLFLPFLYTNEPVI